MNLTTFSLYFSAAGSIHKFSLLCCVGSFFIHAYFYLISPALFDSRVVTIARFLLCLWVFFKMRYKYPLILIYDNIANNCVIAIFVIFCIVLVNTSTNLYFLPFLKQTPSKLRRHYAVVAQTLKMTWFTNQWVEGQWLNHQLKTSFKNDPKGTENKVTVQWQIRCGEALQAASGCKC